MLQKGLTFSPTPKFNHFNLVSDALSFTRKIRMKYHFQQQNTNNSSTNQDPIPLSLTKFKDNSSWDLPPLHNNHPIEQFSNLILGNIPDPSFGDSLSKNKNLTKEEYKEINSLKNNTDIVVLPADNGDQL